MRIKYLALLPFLIYTPLARSAPDCVVNYHFTNRSGDNGKQGQQLISSLPGTSQNFNNNLSGCVAWTMSVSSEGFSGLSIELDAAPNSVTSNVSSPGAYAVFGGIGVSGTNPYIGTTQSSYNGVGFYPWLQVNLTSFTGTGSVDVTLVGWKSVSFLGATNGLPGGNLLPFATLINPTTTGICALHADTISNFTCQNAVTDGTTETAFALAPTIPAGLLSNNTIPFNFGLLTFGTATVPTVTLRLRYGGIGGTILWQSTGAAFGTGNTALGIGLQLSAGVLSSTTPVITYPVSTIDLINRQWNNQLITGANRSVAVNTTIAGALTLTAQFAANTLGNIILLQTVSP